MLVAYEVAGSLIRSLRSPVELVARHDSSLADQLRRAASSILLNVAEGHRRIGRDRLHLFRVAAGSAAEVRAALDIASAWGYVGDETLALPRELVDRELALLWGLTRRAR